MEFLLIMTYIIVTIIGMYLSYLIIKKYFICKSDDEEKIEELIDETKIDKRIQDKEKKLKLIKSSMNEEKKDE